MLTSSPPVLGRRVQATCAICDSDQPTAVRTLPDHQSPEVFHAATCAACGGIYLLDPPAPEDIGRYYETDAGTAMHSRPGPLFLRMRDRRIGSDLGPLLDRLPADAPVADLGTGDGSVADHLHRRGRAAVGLDLYVPAQWPHTDIPYRQVSFTDGGVTTDDLMTDDRPARGAVMRHVLEHVHRPVAVLSALRDAGVTAVLVIVPNVESRLARRMGSAWYYWDPPRHLTFFSADSLAIAARRAGMHVSFLRTYGLDEVATTAHRSLLLRGGPRAQRLARLLRPTGPVAGAASILQAPVSDTVLHAVLEVDGG